MDLIMIFFYAVLTISVFLMIIRVVLSIWYTLHPTNVKNDVDYPAISIVVPAYNEEIRIAQCIQSLCELYYPNYEVTVVDDGSTDNTLAIAQSMRSQQITVIHQLNQGKANALNNGIHSSHGEIIVTVDAETTIHPKSLTRIANRFLRNPQLGAVAGNIKVDSEPGLLNALQSTEYTVGINLIRKTQSTLGCVMIVPGPIAALKT